jgi:probable rRNA maturation factor
MNNEVSVSYLSGRKNQPSPISFRKWICLAVPIRHLIHVKIVNKNESRNINSKFRGINKSTNVLSFCYQNSKNFIWGDLLLCSDVILFEANTYEKDVRDHYAHLTLHGSLHLLGYDHVNKDDALIMESKEVELLKLLGIKSPY